MQYEASDPYSIATFVERSAVFLDGQGPTAMAWKQECVRIAANEPDTIIYASHIQADEPNLRVFYECYRNHDAFRAHEATPHTRRFLAERTRHLASPPEVWTLPRLSLRSTGHPFEATVPRADPTPGALVRSYQIEKNWSRDRLAREMHKSVSWVAQAERGDLPLTDVTILGRLAALFGAPLHEFIEAALGPDTETARDRPYVEQLRLAIAGHLAPERITAPVADGLPCDLGSLRQRTLYIWERIHASAYREMGPAIAALIIELERASRTAAKTQRPELLPLLAQTYQAAAAMLVKVGDRGAGWVAADCAIAAAEEAETPR